MEASPLNLKQIFEPDRRYLVPMFQRPYVWSADAQWRPLWEDIRDVAERLGRSGSDVRPHFLGAIVVDHVRQPTSRVEARLVVDGQQRLTTLQLLLEAAGDICRQRGWDKYHRAFIKLTRNEDPLSEDPDDAFKVWPTNVDREAFRTVMSAESPEALKQHFGGSVNAPVSTVAQAYAFFTSQIEAWLPEADASSSERIGHLYTALREKLRMVVIDLGEKDDPQLIFETLNARGTPLLPADLVKNHLFHEAHQAKLSVEGLHRLHWRHFDEEAAYWRAEIAAGRVKRSRIDLFLQHYLAMQTGEEVQVAHLYAAYQDYLRDRDRPVDEELAALAFYSRVFRRFDEFEPGSRIGVFFGRLEDLETTTAHPLLLHLFGMNLDREELEAAVVALESFLMRRLVCRLTTKNYNRLFLDVLKKVRAVKTGLAETLQQELLSGAGDSVRWPSDAQFRDAWMEMPIYKIQARRRTRMVLEALEFASRTAKTEVAGLQKKLTIEHVLPQSWEEHWPLGGPREPAQARADRERLLHTVGNLTLLTRVLNPSVSNGPWESKRKGLQDSVLILNKQLVQHETWGESEIRKRGKRLFAHASLLWPRPPHPSDGGPEGPAYSELGEKALAETAAPPPEGQAEGLRCPIPECAFTFKKGVIGWDAHAGRIKKHPWWHPEVAEPEGRRALFRSEFPTFPIAKASEEVPGREYWELRSDARALGVLDACESLLIAAGLSPRVSYARHYISFGGARCDFCWLRPQRAAPYCSVQIKTEKGRRHDLYCRLVTAGITATANEKSSPRMELTSDDLLRHGTLLQQLLEKAYRKAGG